MAENTDFTRLLLLIVAIVILLPVVMMLFAWPMMGMWGGGHMWGGGMWDGSGVSWLWPVMWLVPLLILLGGGYLLYQAFVNADTNKTDAALEELRIAYAQGELSDEEFETRRERLQGREKN